MSPFYAARTASLVFALLGGLIHFVLFANVLSISTAAIRWVPDSEWEGSSDPWVVRGVKLAWALLLAYFASCAAVCVVGSVGIIKSRPALVRFYRDFAIADFVFFTLSSIVASYAAFRPIFRTGVCEELSRQPELMRDLVDLGLNLENCELWFERATLALMAGMVVFTVIRLHFLIALANYCSALLRRKRTGLPLHVASFRSEESLQRIYILPSLTPSSSHTLVYAPVPLSSLSPQESAAATEAWIARTEQRQHVHAHHHHHRRSGSGSGLSSPSSSSSLSPLAGAGLAHGTGPGRISLPVTPGEGLLPPYDEVKNL